MNKKTMKQVEYSIKVLVLIFAYYFVMAAGALFAVASSKAGYTNEVLNFFMVGMWIVGALILGYAFDMKKVAA